MHARAHTRRCRRRMLEPMQALPPAALRPSSIEETEDDRRSLHSVASTVNTTTSLSSRIAGLSIFGVDAGEHLWGGCR